jgi:molybdopterin molybdotransferase
MAREPLAVRAARELVLAAARPLGAERVPVGEALDRVLAEDVVAAHPVPPFASSAMDGFAVAAGPDARVLRVAGESRAGRPAAGVVGAGEAYRISTGAVVPDGADAVVPVERARERDGEVRLEGAAGPGDNIRRAGEDLRPGATVLPTGAVLGPSELGVAVGAGRGELRCALRPRVAVLATGDELTEPGAPLAPGEIHDSNSLMLAALAVRAGADVTRRGRVTDDRVLTETTLAGALEDADVVVVSGGVSVGPHDHVKASLEALGVRERFWRVALKPGKPTWFGEREGRLVFGLPGNPVSTYVTWTLFVRPALRALMGAPGSGPAGTAVMAEDVERLRGRDHAVRVTLEPGRGGPPRARPTGPQGSHLLSSILGADALAVVERGEGFVRAGEAVRLEALD